MVIGVAAELPFPVHPHMLRLAAASRSPTVGTTPAPSRNGSVTKRPAHHTLANRFIQVDVDCVCIQSLEDQVCCALPPRPHVPSRMWVRRRRSSPLPRMRLGTRRTRM